MSEHETTSLGVEYIIAGGPSLPITPGPLPPDVELWMEYERDRIANPHTPRPYRPYLTPPPHKLPEEPKKPEGQNGSDTGSPPAQ